MRRKAKNRPPPLNQRCQTFEREADAPNRFGIGGQRNWPDYPTATIYTGIEAKQVVAADAPDNAVQSFSEIFYEITARAADANGVLVDGGLVNLPDVAGGPRKCRISGVVPGGTGMRQYLICQAIEVGAS